MALEERTMYDVKCDWKDCGLHLSEQSDIVYNDEGQAFDDAIEREDGENHCDVCWSLKTIDGVNE